MRVAVWLDKDYKPEIGGGFTYYDKLVKAIDTYQFDSSLDICFVSDKTNDTKYFSRSLILLNYQLTKKNFFKKILMKLLIRGRRVSKKILLIYEREKNKNYIKILRESSIDLIYYIRQNECDIFDFPFIATNWDIGHCSTFSFPELIGNKDFFVRNDFYSRILPTSLMIFVESHAGKKELIKYTNVNENRIKVVPLFAGNCVNIYVDKQQQKVILNKYKLEYQRFFFYPAQFWAHKNHSIILHAFAKFINEHPNFKMVFTGSDQGNLSYMKKLAAKLQIENSVLFLGFVPLEEINSFYCNANSLIMASYLGPTNMPPIEAMELGCPVICSDLEGHREMMDKSAIYFNPMSADELYTAMSKMVKNNNYYKKKIKARNKISKFKIEYTMTKMNEYLKELSIIRECWE